MHYPETAKVKEMTLVRKWKPLPTRKKKTLLQLPNALGLPLAHRTSALRVLHYFSVL